MTPQAGAGALHGGRRAKLRVEGLQAHHGASRILEVPLLSVWERRILGVIGQSGSGKTTLLRVLAGAARADGDLRWSGSLTLDGIPAERLWPPEWSRRVRLLSGRAQPFPGTAADNVARAARPVRGLGRRALREAVEEALASVGLARLLRDPRPAESLPSVERRLLCLARALAVRPEVLLLDEPCIGLDPAAAASFDALLRQLQGRMTLVVVSHNLHQIAGLADDVAVLAGGRLGEVGPATRVFAAPAWPAAAALLTGLPGVVTAS